MNELMAGINSDDRHCNVFVVENEKIAARRFPDWRLAYAGPSVFVERHLRPLVEGQATGEREAVMSRQLITLMMEFASSRNRSA